MEIGLAVGGAFLSSTLQVLFDRLTPQGDFLNLFRGRRQVHRLFKTLHTNLLSIRGVVHHIESHQICDEDVRSWLNLLQDSVDIAENLLDEINYEVIRVKLEASEETTHPQICPVCAKRAGVNLVGHITQQHGNILKVQRKRRFRRGGSNSALSILRKELREGSLQSILGGSSRLVSSSTTDPDPLLSSFINSSASIDEPSEVQPLPSAKACSPVENSVVNLSDRVIQPSPLSEKDQEEKARKCEFVQGMLLSTFLEEEDF